MGAIITRERESRVQVQERTGMVRVSERVGNVVITGIRVNVGSAAATNRELREDGGLELREDGGYELRE
jgi:hypothetical protein